MTAPLGIRSSNFFAYTNTLASLYRTSLWLPDQDSALAQDPNVWEKLQEDIVVKAGIQSRLHKVAGRPSELEAGGKDDGSKLAIDVVQEGCLDAVDNLPQAKLNLSKGVFLGRTYGYINGERRPLRLGGADKPVLDWWVPFHIEDVSRERVRKVPRQFPDPKQGIAVGSPWIEVSDLAVGSWTRLAPDDWANWIEYLYDDDERRLGMGRGGLAAIYLASYIRTMLLKHGLQGVEKLAQGLAVAKIDLERTGSTGKTTEAVKTAFLASLQAQRDAASAIVISKDDELEYVFPSGSGGDLVLKLLDYNDGCLTRYLTFSLLPTGGGSEVGSNARAETESEQSSEVIRYECNLLDDTLTRGLIGQFWRMNRANLARIGIGAARRPRLVQHIEVQVDPKVRAEVLSLAHTFMPIKKSEAYQQLGLTMPTLDDIAAGDVIEVAAPPPSPFDLGNGDAPPGEKPNGSGNPALDRAKGLADEGVKRLGREALNGIE